MLAGIWAREHLKNLGPLLLSATTEAINIKFGTQLRFGEYVTITTLVTNLVGAGWATGAPQKLWVSGYHVTATEM